MFYMTAISQSNALTYLGQPAYLPKWLAVHTLPVCLMLITRVLGKPIANVAS